MKKFCPNLSWAFKIGFFYSVVRLLVHYIQQMVKKLAFTLLMLSLASCATVNRNLDGLHAKVTSYGIFQAEVIEHASANTIFHDVDLTTKQRLLQQTASIPCAIGTRFGVMFDIGNV